MATSAPQSQSQSQPPSAEEEALKRNTDCVYFLASPLTCKKVLVFRFFLSALFPFYCMRTYLYTVFSLVEYPLFLQFIGIWVFTWDYDLDLPRVGF